jgi:hypothetical protein
MLNKLLVSLFVFCFLQASAQKYPFHPEDCKIYYSKPADLKIGSDLLPFSSVTVIDRRFDTSKLGYGRPNSFDIKVIKTKKAFAETISETIAKAGVKKLSGDTSKKLFIVIKHLWLDGQPSNPAYRSTCTASLDVYLKNNEQYSPLFKIDTVLASIKPLLKTDDDLLSAPFQLCFQKFQQIHLEQTIATRRKLSAEQVSAYYQQQFNSVTAKGDSLVKGVFLTFQDFLQNRPAYKEFTVKNEALTDDLYVIENGKETMLSKFWGYCDGKNNYIKLGHSLFRLYRQNKTYDVYGANEVDHRGVPKTKGVSSPDPIGIAVHAIDYAAQQSERDKLIMKAMQLNMETDRVY